MLLRVLVQFFDTTSGKRDDQDQSCGRRHVCVALETSGAAFVAGAALVIGLHDDDDSVR
ncbi:hypothetical protein NKJ72_17195 [Mesorhizobium sp. M0045]|uniref:hypothetical protein n=1 Tax=Mesorhizobium sp. M0045 TaxID=2956857 RepID=UPI00333CED80